MFREWAPLEHVLSRVPPIGRLGQEQDVTCLAASQDYLALGTSCGTVFWYDRKGDTLQRLDCWTTTRVSCLQLVETVDIMLAVGSYEGEVAIFQIPKPVQPGVGAAFPGTAQNIQHFSIRGIHARSITALSWSLNGQKLFSGDKSGIVVCSSIDFFQNSATSRRVVAENQEIISLDYKQKYLLISTIATSLLLNLEDSNADVQCKIGNRERKLGIFGGTLIQMGVGKSGLKAIVMRPNNRFWVSNLEGKVERTVILMEALLKSHSQIPIINPTNIANDENANLQCVTPLSENDKTILLWNRSSLHIVSIERGIVLASCNTLRNILDLTVTSTGEIFVLETGRTLIRLAKTEDALSGVHDWRRGSTVSQGADTALESTVESFSTNIVKKISSMQMLNSFAVGLKSGAWRDKLGLIAKEEVYAAPSSPPEEVVEALEDTSINHRYSPQDPKQSSSQNNLLDVDFKSRMDKIGEQEYEPTLRSPKRQKKRNKRHSTYSVSPGASEIGDSSETFTPPEDDSCMHGEIIPEMLPGVDTDDKSAKVQEDKVELQKNDIEQSADEEINLNETISKLDDMSSDPTPAALEKSSLKKDETQNEATLMKLLNLEEHLNKGDIETLQEVEVSSPCNPEPSLNPMSLTNTKDSSLLSEARYSLPYGPPSDSSALTASIVSNDQKLEECKEEERTPEQENIEFGHKDQEMLSPGLQIGENWQKFELPGQSGSLCENDKFLCFCDNRENVFYSESIETNLSWKRTDFKAIFVSTSPCGSIVWRLHRHTAYCLIKTDNEAPLGGKWIKICENVASLWVGNTTGWLVKLDGGLVCHQNLTQESPHNIHPRQIYTGLFLTSVREYDGFLIALTGQNCSLAQCPLDSLTTESSWSPIFCILPAVSVFSVGISGELWVADSHSNIHFSTDWHSSDNTAQPQATWAKLSLQMSEECEVPEVPGGLLSPALCKPILCSGKTKLWVASPLSSHLLCNPYLISGYHWSKLSLLYPSDQLALRSVFCGSRDAYSGYIILTHLANTVLWTTIHDGRLTQLVLPPGAVLQDISAVPGYLWLLTVRGSIFIRAGISSSQPVGTSWVKLSLGQLAGHRLLSISLGTDQAWAVDDEGCVYMRLGSLLPPPAHASPAWLPVDQALAGQTRVAEGAQLVQVVCSLQVSHIYVSACSYHCNQGRHGVGQGLQPWCVCEGGCIP